MATSMSWFATHCTHATWCLEWYAVQEGEVQRLLEWVVAAESHETSLRRVRRESRGDHRSWVFGPSPCPFLVPRFLEPGARDAVWAGASGKHAPPLVERVLAGAEDERGG